MNEKFLVHPLNQEIINTATFLAKQRLLYEFPRSGYGQYQHNRHVENLRNGYLGELAFLEIMTKRISKKYEAEKLDLERCYDTYKAKALYEKIKNEKFSWEAVIGQTDEGYDFRKGKYMIDIKTYGTDYLKKVNNTYKRISSGREINDLNLYIDERQGKKWINNNYIIFVQAFIEQDLKNIIFAGCHFGLPPLDNNVKNSAYACKVSNLVSMDDLFKELGV